MPWNYQDWSVSFLENESLKQEATGVWEARFCRIWVKILHFFKYKNGGVGPKYFINYWNDFVLGSVEIYFHDFFFLVLEVFQEFHFLHLAAVGD